MLEPVPTNFKSSGLIHWSVPRGTDGLGQNCCSHIAHGHKPKISDTSGAHAVDEDVCLFQSSEVTICTRNTPITPFRSPWTTLNPWR